MYSHTTLHAASLIAKVNSCCSCKGDLTGSQMHIPTHKPKPQKIVLSNGAKKPPDIFTCVKLFVAAVLGNSSAFPLVFPNTKPGHTFQAKPSSCIGDACSQTGDVLKPIINWMCKASMPGLCIAVVFVVEWLIFI